jgi:hypothetical protein
MKNDSLLLDLYTDYLICSSGLVTATGLSEVVDNDISHDKISRFLLSYNGNAKALWHKVKPLVRQLEKTDVGYLIIDDTIEEKPYTDSSELINFHYSHAKHKHVKGINIVTAMLRYGEIAIPIDYHLATKPTKYIDKNNKVKYRSDINKNEVSRRFIDNAIRNQITFEYVLSDIWFSSSDNMKYIHNKKKKFIFGCKSNRLVRFNKIWHKLSELPLSNEQVIHCYIKDVSFPVAITKKVFINDDLSTGVLYLISNDLSLFGDNLYKVYQKRWIIEEFHKSIKQNASLAKSPTKVVAAQSTHVFCAMMAFVKLETLKLKTTLNHFALKNKLFINATRAALNQLQKYRIMPYAIQTTEF